MSAAEMVSCNKSSLFGIEGYYVPKAVTDKGHVFCKKWNSNEKIPTLWSRIKKHGESVPSPNKYLGHDKNFGAGKFWSPKSKRITEFEEIQKNAKKIPGPNHYKLKGLEPTTKLPLQKSDRISFVDDA